MAVRGAEPQRLGTGDVVLLMRGGAHQLGSRARGPSVPLGEAVSAASFDSPFRRFEIGGDGASSHLICGSFEIDGLDWHPLLHALPDVIVVNAGAGRWLSPTLAALERYVSGQEPGAGLVTQRLAEVLFVQALATWLEDEPALSGWLGALRDPQVGRAIARMHAEPSRDWTVEALGRAAGMSRTAFFERFKSLVGEPPATYLVRWRMTLAAKALEREQLTVAQVCERVGYASAPSFTKAFRKHFGRTPAAYRRAHAARASCARERLLDD